MLLKTTFFESAVLSLNSKTTFKYENYYKFVIAPMKNSKGSNYFQIEDIKGNMEITKITKREYSFGSGTYFTNIDYDGDANTFNHQTGSSLNYTFTLTANVNFENVISAVYHLQIPYSQIQSLKIFEVFKNEIILPGYDDLKFTCCVTRNKQKNGGQRIEVHIMNPYNARIDGVKGDYKFEQLLGKIDREISFVIESTSSKNSDGSIKAENSLKNEPSKLTPNSQARKITETGDIDIPPKKNQIASSPTNSSKWYEIMSNNQYSDVTLISSDNIEISSHRCILAKYSLVFEKIIAESTESPVIIHIEFFNAETIQAALGYLYDKIDSINGKEMDVFKFADRYDVKDIMNACCLFFEESVAPSNVCEYIQIAYSKNFKDLKQKCLKILVEKKKEIDSSKFAELPKNILVDFFSL